jgi:heat shock protein HslJ
MLRYLATAQLEDEPWILERRRARRLGTEEVVTLFLVPDVPGSAADVREGAITGEGPCRSYDGTYRTDGLLVAFEELATDDAPCADPRAERRFLRALRRADFAAVEGGTLRLLDGQGSVLLAFETPTLP